MSKNADFFKTCFSQVNDVGLSVYVVYVVTKNGIDWFYWVKLFCFENGILFGKVALWDELCELWDFLVIGRWNAHVCTPTLISD